MLQPTSFHILWPKMRSILLVISITDKRHIKINNINSLLLLNSLLSFCLM